MNIKNRPLIDEFDIWFSAEAELRSGRGRLPGGIDASYGVSKFKELILNLAYCGKLVNQDDSEGDAMQTQEILHMHQYAGLESIKSQKTRSIPPVSEDEKYLEVPKNWVWTRLGGTGIIFNGNSINEGEKLEKYTNLDDGLPFIATKDVGYGDCELDYQNGVLIPFDHNKFKVAHAGSVLICSEGGSAGKKIGFSTRDICFGNKLFANEVFSCIAPKFIFYFYQSSKFFCEFSKRMTGIIGGISLNQFLSIPIPIPPYQEQLRIVSRLDELMTLCEGLGSNINASLKAHKTLVGSFLKRLRLSNSSDEFKINWDSIVENFDVLFTSEEAVESLRCEYLQLAVIGKLVAQDIKDEPAISAIKRFQNEKLALKNNGTIRAFKPLEPISSEEAPFQIPDSWCWVRLKDIVYLLGDGLHGTPIYTPNGEYFFVNGNNLQDGKIVIKDGTKTVSAEEANKHKKDLNDRTMFVSINGTIGNVAFYNNEKIILGKSACYFNLGREFLKEYLKLVFDSPYFLSYANKSVSGTTIMNLSLFSMNNFPVPLPPLVEQSRIVQKVNEIRAICEELKLQIGASNILQRKVADALVEQVST